MKTDSIPLVERAVRSLTDTLHVTLPMGRIVVQPLPGCPGLVLGLINADFPTGPLPPDPDARQATRVNARLNGVAIDVCSGLAADAAFDLVLMADVLYHHANLPLLEASQRIATAVVVADSRVAEIPGGFGRSRRSTRGRSRI